MSQPESTCAEIRASQPSSVGSAGSMVPSDPVVRVLRVGAVAVPIPTYQSVGAAGFDLCAALAEPIVIAPGDRRLVPTGIAIALPRGYEGQVRPRSGLALRHGVTVLNAPGTIDEDYRGEVQVLLVNHGHEPFEITLGDRIAQLVVCPIAKARLEWVAQLDATERGAGGYGSTGR